MSAKLFDFAKEFVELQRVFANESALEKKRVGCTGSVANLSETINSLVRIEANDWARTRSGFYHRGHAHIGDLQLRRRGVGVYRFRVSLKRFAHQQTASQSKSGSLHDITTVQARAVVHCVSPGDLNGLRNSGLVSKSQIIRWRSPAKNRFFCGNQCACPLQASEFLDRFFDRFQLFDVGVHGMFFEIHFLCGGENSRGIGARNNNHTV